MYREDIMLEENKKNIDNVLNKINFLKLAKAIKNKDMKGIKEAAKAIRLSFPIRILEASTFGVVVAPLMVKIIENTPVGEILGKWAFPLIFTLAFEGKIFSETIITKTINKYYKKENRLELYKDIKSKEKTIKKALKKASKKGKTK